MWNIDFLPERIRAQRARKSRLIRQVYLLVLAAGALVGLAYVREGKIKQARAELVELQTRSDDAKQQLDLRAQLERQLAELTVKQRIDEQLGSRVNPRDILVELGRLMPPSMSLSRLALETAEIPQAAEAVGKAGKASRARAAGSSRDSSVVMVKRLCLTLSGLATNDVDVANFIGLLSACPLFEDVHMGYAKTVDFRGREACEFQVRCYLVR